MQENIQMKYKKKENDIKKSASAIPRTSGTPRNAIYYFFLPFFAATSTPESSALRFAGIDGGRGEGDRD